MLGQLLKGFQLVHFVLSCVSAIGFVTFWVHTRFWLPKYAHVLAAVGLAVGVYLVATAPKDAPLGQDAPASRFLFALAIPAAVYGLIVLTGGQKEVFKMRFRNFRQCPNCKAPLTASQTSSDSPRTVTPANRQCPHCGQLLTR